MSIENTILKLMADLANEHLVWGLATMSLLKTLTPSLEGVDLTMACVGHKPII